MSSKKVKQKHKVAQSKANKSSKGIKVINMSSKSLTNAQVKLLSKGLKFTPTPVSNLPELEKDINTFCRTLRLKEYFNQSDSDTDDDQTIDIARNKSKFCPPHNRNKTLDNGIENLQRVSRNLKSLHVKTPKENLTHSERRALKELSQDPSIIIKEADKGGAVCVLDRSFYAAKIKEMLQDANTYKMIVGDQISSILTKVNKLVSEYKNNLTQNEIDYIKNFESKTSNIYGLPKVHKSKTIQDAIKSSDNDNIVEIKSPCDLKFRPIVAGPVCPTSRLSSFVDILIKPLQQYTTSYVRDDIDFLSKIKRKLSLSDSFTLVTFDIESLYTNIDKDLGIEAIRYWIDKHRDKIPARFSVDFICEAIKLILDNNIFHFDGQHFKQIKGTAMGTKMAPSYVNLVLAYLEEKMYSDIKSKHTEEYSSYIKDNFLRYLDDCFIIWCNKWNIDTFHSCLNSQHSHLKYTMEQSASQIPFLDIKVLLQNDEIKTDIYYKPTDAHLHVPFSSCHPRHTKHNIPYSLARRLCTIIDDPVSKKERLDELKSFLLARGYPVTLIDTGIQNALSIPQSVLRQVQKRAENKIMPFVITHNPRNPEVWPLIQSTMTAFDANETLRKVFQNTKVIKSRRQPPNLKNILTRAFFSSNIIKTCGSHKCTDKRCATCKTIVEGDTIKITSTGLIFHIKSNMNCKSKNVLYIITCSKCSAQYVGKTHTSLAKRNTLHRQHINHAHYRKLEMSTHIDECGNKKYSIVPFYKLSDDKVDGDAKEHFFIQKFKPALNQLGIVRS